MERLNKTWTSAAFDREKNEWVHTTLHSYENLPDEPLWQAERALIRPSKAKPLERPYKSLVVFSDAQMGFRRVLDYDTKEYSLMPLHDERALKIAQMICKDLRPDEIINLGDTFDGAEFSRFKPDSTHFHNVTAPTMQAIHDFYAQLRADNPQAKITEVDSNHNLRIDKAILENIPQLANFTRPGENKPMMVYEYMANLEHLGVDFISGYGAAEYEYKDDLAFIHGTLTGVNGIGNRLAKQNPDRNIVQGHNHRAERYIHTDRKGRQLGAFVVGALCRTDGTVPSFHNGVNHQNYPVHYQENWTQGLLHILDFDGYYQFDDIAIVDGKAFYNGREYNA